MRLIEARTLSLREFYGDSIPQYAILSHAWGDEEVTFKDWEDLGRASKKAGYAKIKGACAKALEYGLEWVWVDTNCIDKTSSTELTEAINSMFDWYARSKLCFAFLVDVPSNDGPLDNISHSRWWTRGWTLQELVAPSRLIFYAADWTLLGDRDGELVGMVSETTGIDHHYFGGPDRAKSACIALKMSWLAKRTTTRIEDMAYCMLGLFDISMPLLYGEGSKAFTRLQHEILRASNDHTIFCWTWTVSVPSDWVSLLAPSPSQFKSSEIFRPNRAPNEVSIYSMTNAGLSIRLPIIYSWYDTYFIVLEVSPRHQSEQKVCIQVAGQKRGSVLHVSRCAFAREPMHVWQRWIDKLEVQPLIVKNKLDYLDRMLLSRRSPNNDQFGCVLAFVSKAIWKQLGRGQITVDDICPASAFSNPATGSFSLEFTNQGDGVGVGAVLVRAKWLALPDPGYAAKRFYIFAAIRISRTRICRFCQLFTSWKDIKASSKECKEILEHLKRQVPKEGSQTTHYHAGIGLSITMDSIINTPKYDRDISFLLIHSGCVVVAKEEHMEEGSMSSDANDRNDSRDDHESRVIRAIGAFASRMRNTFSRPREGVFRAPGFGLE
jgi:hypothetical protein